MTIDFKGFFRNKNHRQRKINNLERLKSRRWVRVKDVDFERGEILIRDGKGAKDRVTMLPESLKSSLLAHLHLRRTLFDNDTKLGKASVY